LIIFGQIRKLKTIVLLFLISCFVTSTAFAQETKIGINFAFNEIYYHTGNTDDGLSEFNIGVSSVSAAFHISKKYKKLGFSFESGIIEKAGLLEAERNTIPGFIYEYHLHFYSLIDYYPIRKLNFSFGPEFTFPLTRNIISDDQINFGSLIFGMNYNVIKRMDLGIRLKYGLLPMQGFVVLDENGNPIGETRYYNDYIQVYFRFNLYNNMDIIDLRRSKNGRKRIAKKRR
jgi:hypothetical protein